MPQASGDPNGDELNPANEISAKQLAAHEQAALDHVGAEGREARRNGGANAADAVRDGEEASNQFRYDPQGYRERKKRHKGVVKEMSKVVFKGPLGKNKGASLVIGALLMFIVSSMPFIASIMKLDILFEPITQKMSQIPEYAIEQRVEYMVTRWLAMMVMKEAYPGDENIVFCRGGGLLCHLGSTKYSAWFTKKLDAKFEKQGRSVKVVLNATGKTGLGGHATDFSVSLENIGDKDVGKLTHSVSRQLKGHKEARRVVNTMVKQAHGRNYILRFISKGILYRKYGIRRYSLIPDRASKNIAERKAKIQASILKNTIGRVSSRMAVYLGCLQGDDSLKCKETIDKLSDDFDKKIQDAQDEVDKHPEGSEERENAQKKLDSIKSKKEASVGIKSAAEGAAEATSKSVAKEIMKKSLGPIAAASALDMVFGAIGALDKRVLEVISQDRMAQAGLSLMFDDHGGAMLMKDQVKLGNVDMETHGIISSMFDGAESSAYFQLLYAPGSIISSEGLVKPCQGPDGKEVFMKLPPGDTICPENMIVRDWTTIKKESWWPPLANVAHAWNTSIGRVFDAVDSITSLITGPLFGLLQHVPGFKEISAFFLDLMESLLSWMFGIPTLGVGASGRTNFEVGAGSIQVAANSTAEHGQNPENQSGPAHGIGGARMSDTEMLAVINEKEGQRRDEFEQQTMFAKLFDPTLYGSAANHFFASTLQRSSSSVRFLLSTPGQLINLLAPKPASAASPSQIELMKLKAFGLPTYGYADKSVFTADPDTYTPEFCAASAKAREDSLTLDDSTGELVPTYKKTDPCALEKVIGGMFATAADDTENPLYVKEPGTTGGEVTPEQQSSGGQQSGSGPVANDPLSKDGWVWPVKERLSPGPCWGRNVGTLGRHAGMDINVNIPNAPIYAMHDGEVIAARDGGAAGKYIHVRTTKGMYYIYQHLSSISVRVGDQVKANQEVAKGGKTGRVDASSPVHLHIVVSRANDFPSYGSLKSSIDPMSVLPTPAPSNYRCT